MYYKDCINNDPGLNLTHFMAMSNLVKIDIIIILFFFLVGGGGTVAALGLKVSQSNQLKLMKLNEYQRSRSFFDLGQRSLRFQFFSQKLKDDLKPVHMKISGRIGKKIYINELGHITKMATFKSLAHIWNKPLKIVFSKTDDR